MDSTKILQMIVFSEMKLTYQTDKAYVIDGLVDAVAETVVQDCSSQAVEGVDKVVII